MPRRKTDKVKVTLYLPQHEYAILQALLYDPAAGRAKYGGVSGFFTSLLRKYLDDVKPRDEAEDAGEAEEENGQTEMDFGESEDDDVGDWENPADHGVHGY